MKQSDVQETPESVTTPPLSDDSNDLSDLNDANCAVNLTAEASQAATALLNEHPEWQGLPLRVYLSGKGCDGFEYGVAFDAAEPDDIQFALEGQPISLVVDPKTLGFIGGSTIEWVEDERGKGFVVNNPNHRRFRGKFYKAKTWEDRLVYRPRASATI